MPEMEVDCVGACRLMELDFRSKIQKMDSLDAVENLAEVSFRNCF